MEALKQYIDLFKDHRELLDSHSCQEMNSLRDSALKILEKKGLPKVGSENYEITDLEKLLSPDFGLNLARIPIDTNPWASFHCGVPSMSAAVYFQINDIFDPQCRSKIMMPIGVHIGSLREYLSCNPELAKKYYGRIADIGNPLVALNTILAQDGVVIWVKAGVKVETPVQLVNILHNGMPLMAVRRMLIVLEDDAEFKLVSCDHSQHEGIDFLTLQTVEVYAGKNSRLEIYELEESTEKTVRLSSLYLRQERGSEVLIEGMTLFNGVTRNEYHCHFKGERSLLRLMGLGIEDKTRQLDTYSRVDHTVGECVTDEMFKYVVDDEAKGAFAGLIKVERGAAKTEAYQSNRNIVGSETARMYSKPQLEIYDDDVKCSHGCTVGQLDENQVFYMQTRGIPENEAKLLLKQAFMADIIDKVSIPSLRDRLKSLVEKRFAGETFNCSGCGADCGQDHKEIAK